MIMFLAKHLAYGDDKDNRGMINSIYYFNFV